MLASIANLLRTLANELANTYKVAAAIYIQQLLHALFKKKNSYCMHRTHALAACLLGHVSFSTSADRIDCGVCWYNSAAKSGRSDEEESTLQRQAAGCRDFRAELQRRKADTYVCTARHTAGRRGDTMRSRRRVLYL